LLYINPLHNNKKEEAIRMASIITPLPSGVGALRFSCALAVYKPPYNNTRRRKRYRKAI
jgi:hypothetical protein